MVRRQLINKKTNNIRVTKTEQYLVNKKYLGDEPVFTTPLSNIDYINALNWYNYMCSPTEAREYLNDYLTNTGRVEYVKKLNTISDVWLPCTVAWVARMLTKGYKLPNNAHDYVESRICDILSNVVEAEIEEDIYKVTVRDRMNERIHDILGEVEGLVDDFVYNGNQFSFYDWLKQHEISSVYVTSIVNKLKPIRDELVEVVHTKDEQLKEGYRHLKMNDIQTRIRFFNMMIDDAERYSSNTKKTRKPRKKKVISVDRQIKNLKWQKEDSTFKIASVQPEKIIGSQELWTFNTKYKTLTVLRAKDRGGLQVKGTSIINYNEETSLTKRTGRRSEEHVKTVLNGGKIILRKVMDNLKYDAPLAYRINENTILLRVMS
jgi:hypothetical protein